MDAEAYHQSRCNTDVFNLRGKQTHRCSRRAVADLADGIPTKCRQHQSHEAKAADTAHARQELVLFMDELLAVEWLMLMPDSIRNKMRRMVKAAK